MKVIWKFSFHISNEISLEMPKGAEILSVQMQNGIPVMWVICEETYGDEIRNFTVFGTGWPLLDYKKYLGTLQEFTGLVWHIFEV